jgi:hypothetical protein
MGNDPTELCVTDESFVSIKRDPIHLFLEFESAVIHPG